MDSSNSFSEKILLLKSCFSNSPQQFLEERLNVDCPSTLLKELRINKIDSLYYLHTKNISFIQSLYNQVLNLQINCLKDLLNELRSKKIRPIVFKGAELAQRYYDGNALSMSNDVDLLFQYHDLYEVKAIMHTLGYRQGNFDKSTCKIKNGNINEIARLEAIHYELVPFKKAIEITISKDQLEFAKSIPEHPIWIVNNKVYVVVEFDIHHQLAADIMAKPFFQRSIPSSFEHADTLNPTDHLWFMTSKLYNEVARANKRSLRDFVYMSHLLSKENIDWDQILEISCRYNIKSTLYYFFTFLSLVETNIVPLTVLNNLKPSKESRNRDFGWQMLGLFGFEDKCPLEEEMSKINLLNT